MGETPRAPGPHSLTGAATASLITIWLATAAWVLTWILAVGLYLMPERFSGLFLTVVIGLLIVQVLSLIAWIPFIVWLYVARTNIDTFEEAMPGWGRGWTIGAWFLPVAGVLLGPAVVADVAYWSVDDHGVSERRRRARAARRWWLCYVTAGLVIVPLLVWPRHLGAAVAVEIADTTVILSTPLLAVVAAIGFGLAAAINVSRVIAGASSGHRQRVERTVLPVHLPVDFRA